jgi:hypothetical protein
MRCREYVVVHPENPKNQEIIRLFEGKHRGHTVVTSDINEVKGSFTNFQGTKPEDETSEETSSE